MRARVALLGAVVVAGVAWLLTVAVPVAGADSCPNAAYRTGPSAGLPDCRAYEMVTPPFKDGAYVGTRHVWADGANLLVNSVGGFNGAEDDFEGEGSNYDVARTGSGWTSTPVDPSLQFYRDGINGGRVLDVSHDFSRSLYFSVPRSAAVPADERIYMREPGGSFVEVGPLLPPAAVAAWHNQTIYAQYMGGSADLSHVLWAIEPDPAQSLNVLWPGDGTIEFQSLYEYVGTGNSAPRLVGVDDGGHQISQCGTSLGGYPTAAEGYNAVSASGTTVFFTAREGGCSRRNEQTNEVEVGAGPRVSEVYARVGGSRTVAISEPAAEDCTACDTTPADQQSAFFQGASRDGSRVIFLTSQPLLEGDSTQNLYLYDFGAAVGHRLVRISAGDPAGADVEGVVRLSEDGSHIYFVAGGVLTDAANGLGQRAVEGANNLYVYEPDSARPGRFKVVFIAALSESDQSDWGLPDDRHAEATPDGRFLLFLSANGLTPDCAGGCGTQQAYRYDAQSGELVRVSIGNESYNQNGITGSMTFPVVEDVLSWAAPKAGSMSEDGAYVFFQSPAGLTSQALNNICIQEVGGECEAKAYNVYEYHGGHVYLLSDGQDRHEVLESTDSILLGASPSGADVYFTTGDPLVAQDGDTMMDLYDARIGGGFPAPSVPSSCQGDGCQGGLSAIAPAQVPGSVAFAGPGNPLAPSVTAKKVKSKRPVVKRKAKARKHKKRQAGARRATEGGRR